MKIKRNCCGSKKPHQRRRGHTNRRRIPKGLPYGHSSVGGYYQDSAAFQRR